MDYETIIGLEVHAQLLTGSKMFCSCNANYTEAEPNSHVCPVCLGMPGVLPVINQKAVEYAMLSALALNCTVSEYTKFDRKNYNYPDLMKGYQISQYDFPIGKHGWLTIDINGNRKQVNITRVHLEEDVAKLHHEHHYSRVDVNRAGLPLMEIVSEPEISSPEEARDYLMKLHSILRYLGVSTCNMEDGSFRCDANISIRPIGCKELMAKVEVKNMNSFKAVYQALEYESRRQRKAVKEGEPIFQETRGWLDEKGETVSQRSKECADDYRYFPEPDLPPLIIDKTWIAKIKEKLPELPEARKNRFVAQYGLLLHDASVLTGSLKMADYFEECVKLAGKERAKAATTWILGDLSRLLNASGTGIGDTKVRPEHIADIIKLTGKNTISGPAAKTIIEETFHTGKSVDDIINDKDLRQVNDISEIQDLIKQAINDNPKAISDYRAGKEQALMFITGQVVKATSGRANPVAVKEILIEELGGK